MSLIMPNAGELQKYGVGKFVDNPNSGRFGDANDAEVWKHRHDVSATSEAIQTMIAGGTPNWFKWPEEYKSFVKESFAEEKERSDKMGAEYRWADQDMLTNKEARQINGMPTRDILERKLKANGIVAFVYDNGWVGHGGRPTVGLWAVPPNRTNKIRPICFLDVPMMYEWSVLKLDPHGIPSGFESRGWRDMAVQLVEKDIITESQCHRIFGAPPSNRISARYYRSLWEKRNGKPWNDDQDQDVQE